MPKNIKLMQYILKPTVISVATILSTFKQHSGKKEPLASPFERVVLTLAGLCLAFCFIVFFALGIFILRYHSAM